MCLLPITLTRLGIIAVACFVFKQREYNKLALSRPASEKASKYSGGYEGGLTSDRCRREPVDGQKLFQHGAFCYKLKVESTINTFII